MKIIDVCKSLSCRGSKALTSHELISYLSFLGYEFTHELRSIRWVTKELSRGEQTSWVSNVESVM